MRVRLRSDVMTAVERGILSAVAAAPGLEVGGILLGRAVQDGDGLVLDVSDHRIFPSTRPPGQPYGLPPEALRNLLQQGNASDGEVRIIGYFRTQADAKFQIRAHEYAVVNHFPDRLVVFLLIHEIGGKPVTAGILHWEGADFGKTPVLFNVGEASKPEASRPAEVARAPRPAYTQDATPARGGTLWRGRSTLVVAALVAGAFAAGGIGAYWLRSRATDPNAPAIVSRQNSVSEAPGGASPLQLTVSHAGDALLLTWNTQAAPSVKAGQMVITDGNAPPQAVFLGSDELRSGKILYRAQSARLRFRLDLIDSTDREMSDSILVLGGPEPPVEPTPNGHVPAPARPPASGAPQASPTGSREKPGGRPETATRNEAPAPAAKFVPPRPSTGTADRTVVLELPRRIMTAPAPALTGLQIPPPVVTPAPPSAAPQPAVAETAAYTPPVVLSQVVPQLDQSLRSLILQDVQVEAVLRIDESGRVVSATVVNPGAGFRSHLDRAAIAAAKRWRFRPAQMGGKNIPSVQTVRFVFRK
jgi:protein TonB